MRMWDVDLRIPMGHITLNVMSLSYEPPVPGWSYSYHCHSSYEIHYILDGYGTLKVGGGSYPISPGTVYLTGPGIYHEQIADTEKPMSEFCLNIEFKRSKRKTRKEDAYIRDEIEGLMDTLSRTQFWIGLGGGGSLAQCRSVMEELEDRRLGRYAMIQNMLIQIVIGTIRQFSGGKRAEYDLPRRIPFDSRRLLVDNYFRDPARATSPGQLADLIGVSVRQLERILLSYYGTTFARKMMQSRIQYTKELLEESELPLQEIVDKAGFSSPGYMHRQFKAVTGDTPAAYRRKRRIGHA